MSLLGKISRIRKPGMHRSPSQDSTGSATTVIQSSIKKRRNAIKIKPKKAKVGYYIRLRHKDNIV